VYADDIMARIDHAGGGDRRIHTAAHRDKNTHD
jgi:hypothetical protein